MSPKAKFLVAFGAVAVYVAAGIAVFFVALWSDLGPGERNALERIASGEAALALGVAALFLLGLAALVGAFFRLYVSPAQKVAEETNLLLSVNPGHRIRPTGARELRELVGTINELARRQEALEAEVKARISRATADLEEERDRLAAVMGELTHPVLVCNREGRITLYNDAAKRFLGRPRDEGDGGEPDGAVGLGRSVFGIVDRRVIARALEKALRRAEGGALQPVSHFATTMTGGRLVRIHVAPVREGDRETSGFLLAFDEAGPGVDADARTEELDDMAAEELVAGVGATVQENAGIAVTGEEADESLWLAVDARAIVAALAHLAGRLRAEHGVREVALRAHEAEGRGCLDLLWEGDPLDPDTLAVLAMERLVATAVKTPVTVAELVERHAGELSSGRDAESGRACVRLVVPVARVEPPHADTAATAPSSTVEPPRARYDFDLLDVGRRPEWDERLLGELVYTVFDVEATGPDPSGGDEIVSIGAVRIVNGRLLHHESFDELVDPRRPIAAEALRVHGISPEMLSGRPPIQDVLPRFARFAEESVLVGHNVAFDMRFLQLKEDETGVRFAQPVLDTLLLSAVVHPNQDDHSLEAIAARLGTSVIGRHSALGDAILTGEIFLGFIPLLAADGVLTLAQAREAARKTEFAKVTY